MKEGNRFSVDAGPVEFNFDVSIDVKGIEIIPADSIDIEKSATPKYLGTKSGAYLQVYSRVFVTVYGERREITRDSLPEESQIDKPD